MLKVVHRTKQHFVVLKSIFIIQFQKKKDLYCVNENCS